MDKTNIGIAGQGKLPRGRRDVSLDMYRGLAMIYILCVIHPAYWLGMLDEPFKSLILFEMPVIFFISGAAMTVSGSRRGLARTIKNRFKRLMLPYYAYILCCAAMLAAWGAFRLIFTPDSGAASPLTLRGLASALLVPRDNALADIPYMYHLWFVVPYLAVCCLFVFERRLLDRVPRFWGVALAFAVCCLSQLSPVAIVREVAAYNLFLVMGYLLYKRLSVKTLMGGGNLWCRPDRRLPGSRAWLHADAEPQIPA